ncbi:splicing factor arginine:serine rich 8 [Echinococcus multilocularis]|uniref:Splicing factor arginine:serine rich 8 n=1 Tax=Echinococcus multilocularis TaxID=6211 RepID=A0A068Y7W6_ECHMU|nr:splicing factor arginine:serine rich 8 [Echinococcus multilocularis]
MDQSQLEGCGELRVVGCRCSLFNDPEKSLEINSGKLLVPWANNSNLTIDRFDCRGYLQDVTEYDADSIVQRLGSQTAEDADLEEMCNYERYLELQTDTHDVAILQGDNPNKETEGPIGTYTTVGFSYDENESEEHKAAQDLPNSKEVNIGPDKNETSKEHVCEPYICPPDLVLPSDVVLPDFERQAAIIEKTAVFIARNNAQMEIVLKTKQSKNPQFSFLNYDDKLNPFYKELVRLIKTGRYIPRQRPLSSATRLPDPNAVVNPDEPYEIKLPKIDISKTAYASLIKRFKKSTSDSLNPNHSSANYAESDDRRLMPDIQRNTSAAETMETRESSEFSLLSEADYEHCYQEYYRYYYPHYYTHFLKGDNAESANESYLVAESARAAATAASAAVNAMRQSHLASKSGFISPPSDLRGIIDKMAEYVARNGEEFQEVVKKQKQNDTRFAFLETGHIHHDYYLAKKKEFVAKACPSMRGETRSPNIEVDRDPKHATLKQEKNSPTVARNKSISFRLIKSVSSSRLKGMDESSPSPAASCEDPSILRTSSYSVLPGMSNYSSASDSEEDNEKDPPNFSPSLNTYEGESMERTFVTVLEVPNASLPNGSRWEATTTLSSSGRSPTPPCSSGHDTTPSVFPTTVDGAPRVVSTTILTPEEIARDIQSMEEQARLQLERRKRAALFAAKLRQSKLMKVEREVEEEGKHSRTSSHLTLSPSQSIILQTATAAPPPPPSSVPAAVAHAVVAQLKTQRERALEAAAAAGDERKKAHNKSRSPPAAYARRRQRSSASPPDGGTARASGCSSRSQRQHSRSVSRDRGRSHVRKHHQKRSGQRV